MEEAKEMEEDDLMESHRSVPFLIRMTLVCWGLCFAQLTIAQEWTPTFVPETGIEAHRLTLGRQFVLFNQVLFGGGDSPQLSIRYAYDPQAVQNWILNDSVEEARRQVVAAIVDARSDVMLLPPDADVTRLRGPYRVSVDRPSTVATQGPYEIGDGNRVGVASDGVWHVLDSVNTLFLTNGVPELVYDLEMAINQNVKVLIGLDTKIEGLDYESFLIEGPLVSPQMEASPPVQPVFPGQ